MRFGGVAVLHKPNREPIGSDSFGPSRHDLVEAEGEAAQLVHPWTTSAQNTDAGRSAKFS